MLYSQCLLIEVVGDDIETSHSLLFDDCLPARSCSAGRINIYNNQGGLDF